MELTSLDLELPTPRNYFQGLRLSNLTLADNVLLFVRRDRAVLSQRNFESRPHHRFVLIINRKTPGSINVDGVSYRTLPGEAFLIAPFQFHFYLDLEEDALEWVFMTFESEQKDMIQPLVHHPVRLDAEDWRLLQTILMDYSRLASFLPERQAPGIESNIWLLQCNRLLQRLLAHTRQHSTQSSVQPSDALAFEDPLVHRINHCLESADASVWRLDELAQSLHISSSHLRRRFRRITGMSLGHYLIHYRMNRAIKLLVHAQASLTEIAEECGYESLAAFSRSFKAMFGSSPSCYRKNLTNRNPS